MNIKDIVDEILKTKAPMGGIDSIFFVACGGSFAGFYPAYYLIEHESKGLITGLYTSNEFVHAPPNSCGKNSLVLACSMRGTPETSEAARIAKDSGAAVVAFYVQESALTDICDYKIQYGSIAEDDTKIETTNASLELLFAFELLYRLEGYSHHRDALEAFDIVDDIYRQAVSYCTPKAEAMAKEWSADPVIYVMGGGPSMGAAYIFSICNLMEMQWIHSPTINTGELLHGPFEAVDKNLPIFLLVSEGRTRPVDLRALDFIKTYGERYCVLDAKEIGINRIDDSVAEYFNHILFSSLLNNVYLRQLSYARKHPYTNRRYMWKVKY